MTADECPFCHLAPGRVIDSNEQAIAIRDRFPVNEGHTLIVTRRHVQDWFEASGAERNAILELVERQKRALDEALHPAGYNLGINLGQAAGQTVMHLHVHIIPRFAGDVDDPTGGVRLVIPERGNYRQRGRIPRVPEGGGARGP